MITTRSILLVPALLTLLCACSANPTQTEAFFTTDIVDLRDSKGSERYWEWKQSRYSFRPVMAPSEREPCWFAQIDYIIDSNGNVFNAEVVEIRPDERFKVDALRMLAMHEYVPAETNPDRVPIYSTITLEMKMAGRRCEWD
jgi:hypothetical protein